MVIYLSFRETIGIRLAALCVGLILKWNELAIFGSVGFGNSALQFDNDQSISDLISLLEDTKYLGSVL
jgi:hypothetical protein